MLTITIPCAECETDMEFVVTHVEDLETFPWSDRTCGTCLSSEMNCMEEIHYVESDYSDMEDEFDFAAVPAGNE